MYHLVVAYVWYHIILYYDIVSHVRIYYHTILYHIKYDKKYHMI